LNLAVSTIFFDRLNEILVDKVFSRIHIPARSWPGYLCHYTKEEGLRGILRDQRIRAYSADSQENDREEIAYGCKLFAELIDKTTASRKVSTFTGRILTELKSLPKERSCNVFLASFCKKKNDRKLFEEFGPYSLCFVINPAERIFISAPRGLASEHGFKTELLAAIYDRKEQKIALSSLLSSLVETLEDQSLIRGPDPPWAAGSAKFIALTISDLALSLITRLKKKEFRRQSEWRIVIRPGHRCFSSDPYEADRNCECYIKTESRRYVELSATEPEPRLVPGAVFGLPTPPLKLPIGAVRIGPFKGRNKMAELARQLLDEHGLGAACVLRSGILAPLKCLGG